MLLYSVSSRNWPSLASQHGFLLDSATGPGNPQDKDSKAARKLTGSKCGKCGPIHDAGLGCRNQLALHTRRFMRAASMSVLLEFFFYVLSSGELKLWTVDIG